MDLVQTATNNFISLLDSIEQTGEVNQEMAVQLFKDLGNLNVEHQRELFTEEVQDRLHNLNRPKSLVKGGRKK